VWTKIWGITNEQQTTVRQRDAEALPDLMATPILAVPSISRFYPEDPTSSASGSAA
jgi:hypothetical protein